MDGIGIDFVTVLGMPPVEFVHLAADLDCHHIGLGPAPLFPSPIGNPVWSLRNDKPLRDGVLAAMRARDVSICLGEGFLIRPEVATADYAADLDLMCELGAQRINMCSIDPDMKRSFDACATLVEMAEGLGLETTLEFGPLFAIPDLTTALAALQHVGRPGLRLLIDTLHLARAGLGAKDVAALDPDLIGYAQLCDAPRAFTKESYTHEARFERLPPGAGELPIRDIVAVLPRNIVLGLEIPSVKASHAGVDPFRHIARCLKAARDLIAEVDREKEIV